MKTGAIVTAGGKPANLPEFDPTFIMGETSAIKKIIITLQKAKIDPIVAVTGYKAEELEKHVAGMGVTFLRNEDYLNRDMLDSVRTGVKYLKEECDRVFVIPADIPAFLPGSLDLLMAVEGPAVCPTHDGKPGHPILIKSDLFDTILEYKGFNGLWGAVTSSEKNVLYINVDDEGVLLEADSKENLNKLVKVSSKNKESLRYEIQLRLGRNELVFDPVILQFLETVNRANSMQTACKQMHISYSKGLKMIRLAEKETGLTLLERRAGGSEGGVSFLTPKGRDFVNAYVRMREELESYGDALFDRYFKAL